MRKTCGSISIIARGMPPSTPAATHAPDLPDLGYNGRGRGAHDHQRQFPLDADGCGDLLGNGLLDDLGGHHPACFLLEDIRE